MNDKTPLQNPPEAREAEEKTLSRRKLFRAAVATAPVILTLPSGAALARSSNLIGETTPGNALDGLNRTLCLDRRSGVADMGTKIDLGTPPSGYGVAIVDRDYRIDKGGTAITEGEMCVNGGTYFYKPDGGGPWVEITVNGTNGDLVKHPGMLMSATAWSSFLTSINMTEI